MVDPSTSNDGIDDSSSIEIRDAMEEDLNDVWRMWKDIMDQGAYYPYDPETYTRQDIERDWITLSNPAVRVAVTSGNNKVVGAYIVKANQPGYGKHVANAAYMVDTLVRGKGVGKLLCQDSINTARALGFRGMQFNLVVATNHSAIRVWKLHGFEIVGTIPEGFYLATEKKYVDAYIFYKPLL